MDILGAIRSAIGSSQQTTPYISPLAQHDPRSFAIVDALKAQNPTALNTPMSTLLDLAQKYKERLLPDVDAVKGALSQLKTPTATAQAKENSAAARAPVDQPVPTGTQAAMDYISSQTPGGKDPAQYYKAFQDPDFMSKIQAADKLKPGLANLLLLQAFHESTLGNAGNNIFGVLPGGEGNQGASFAKPSDAIDYQLSPNVLGGSNKNMNILSDNNPLTISRIVQLYKSYNPEGSYINSIVGALK